MVFARVLDAAHFALTPESTMLGRPVRSLTRPRATTNGEPRFDLFAFELNGIRVAAGDIVQLEAVELLDRGIASVLAELLSSPFAAAAQQLLAMINDGALVEGSSDLVVAESLARTWRIRSTLSADPDEQLVKLAAFFTERSQQRFSVIFIGIKGPVTGIIYVNHDAEGANACLVYETA